MARPGLEGQAWLLDLIYLPLSTPCLPGEERRDARSRVKWRKWERLEQENQKGKSRRGRDGS